MLPNENGAWCRRAGVYRMPPHFGKIEGALATIIPAGTWFRAVHHSLAMLLINGCDRHSDAPKTSQYIVTQGQPLGHAMPEIVPVAVLVVEDEALIRLDFAEMLRDAGYQTYEASNAAEAIAVLELHSEIRAVFTDIQMPGDMDGLQLSHYIRNRWPPTVIVVCSANELPSTDVMPKDASFISKPYEFNALGKVLSHVDVQLAAQ